MSTLRPHSAGLQILPTYPFGPTAHSIRTASPTIVQTTIIQNPPPSPPQSQSQPIIIIQNPPNVSHHPPPYQDNFCYPSACYRNPCTNAYYTPRFVCPPRPVCYYPVRNFC